MERHTLTDDAAVVTRERIADERQCAAWWQRLQDARAAWCDRGNGFFTLGAATYLDLCPPGSWQNYHDRALAANAVLRDRFGDLLEAVAAAITRSFERPSSYEPGLALPGFHVFTAPSLRSRYRDSFHLDLQHQYLPIEAHLLTSTLTFTMPIALPETGGGIEFCEPKARGRSSIRLEPYAIGELFVHSGRVLHRRSHFPASPTAARVTLQGHAIQLGDIWTLYW